jgi:hypothetical protein
MYWRRHIAFIVLLIAVVLLFYAFALMYLSRRICLESFENIHIGMNLEEVIAIIRSKPGVYTNMPTDEVNRLRFFPIDPEKDQYIVQWHEWISNQGAIHIGLDKQQKVIWKYFIPVEAQQPTHWPLRSWFWRLWFAGSKKVD